MGGINGLSSATTLGVVTDMMNVWTQSSDRQIQAGIDGVKAQTSNWAAGLLSVLHSSHSGLTTTLANTELKGSQQDKDYGYRSYLEQWIEDKADVTAANDALSSKQISDALYSGQGAASPGGTRNSQFSDMLQSLTISGDCMRRMADMIAAWQASGMPDGVGNFASTFGTDSKTVTNEINSLRASAADGDQLAATLSQAFASRTLTFRKATDVVGLDYSRTDVDAAYGGTETGTTIENYNQNFADLTAKTVGADGKHHVLDGSSVFGVTLYLSW